MCRFLAYIGQPLSMDDLIFKPQNSLIKQSIHANETDEPLNGDGFGIGWYMPDREDKPGLFTSVRPAWSDRNLKSIAPKIKADCIFAHVRAASFGYVNEFNCHPFMYEKFLFMHNGDIEGFGEIKRELQQKLSDKFYNVILGQTDSEHFFALFLENFYAKNLENNAENIAVTLEETIFLIQAMKRKRGINLPTYINAAITNGDEMVAIRYISDSKLEATTLYYSEGSMFFCNEKGLCEMRTDTSEKAVLVVSEKLTDDPDDWKVIPPNHLLVVNRDLQATPRACGRSLQVE